MSLLLQALKKAEEDKRRRAALTAAELEPSTEFPALNLVDDESAQPEPSSFTAAASETEPTNEWVFAPQETVELVSEANAAVSVAETSLAAIDMSAVALQVEPTTPLVESALGAPASAAVADDAAPLQAAVAEPVSVELTAPLPPVPEVNTASAAAKLLAPANSVAPQALAKSLFAKRPRPQGRGLLPWLVLGASLLLAGMLAWFTWQYRQLTQPSPNLAVNSVASAPITQAAEPGYIAEPIVNEASQPDTSNPVVEAAALPAATVVPLNPLSANQAAQPAPRVRDALVEQNLAPKFIRQTANPLATEPTMQAWQAYQGGDFVQAERIYRKVLQSDPRQRDALLGLAAIAQQRGEMAEAEGLYRRLLRLNPQDDAAKAALLSLNSAQMPEKDAVQLEQSGKADPLVLGHYFAAQQRWGQAQEQFFLAYTANPNSADAALNLAVSLDHLSQTALARGYYRKALQAKEQSNFDRSKVEQRLLELDSATEQKP